MFFLTAKGSGRALALNALETIRRSEPGAAAARASNSLRARSPANIPTRPATASPARWPGLLRPPAGCAQRRSRARSRWTARRCARSRWPTRSARTTWARRWRAGATWSSATTTTSSTARRMLYASDGRQRVARRRAGGRSAQPGGSGPGDVQRAARPAQLRSVREAAPAALKKPLERLHRAGTRLRRANRAVPRPRRAAREVRGGVAGGHRRASASYCRSPAAVDSRAVAVLLRRTAVHALGRVLRPALAVRRRR